LQVLRTISGNYDEVIDMACIGPDRTLLALATNTESVKLVSIAEVDKPNNSPRFGSDVALLEGHQDIIICMDVDWSGYWLATGAKDNTAKLWRLDPSSSSYTCFATFSGHAESLGAIALPRSPPVDGPAAKSPSTHPPAFLLTGSQDKTVKRWDTAKLKYSPSMTEPHSGAKAVFTRVAHEKDINAIDVSPIAPLFASASQDRTIKIWSVEDGSVVGILRGHKRGVWSVRFSPAGTPPLALADGGSSGTRGLLVSGSGDRTIKVWSLSTYTCLQTFEGHSNSVLKVVWIPPSSMASDPDHPSAESRQPQTNQPMIASASSDTLVKLWSPYSGADSDHLLATLDNHTDRVWALAAPTSYNSDTSSTYPYPLISGAGDATLTFWRDTTVQTATQASQRASERIEQDQQLQNYILSKDYREAITLSLALNHPGRLLRVFEDVAEIPEAEKEPSSIMGVSAVDEVLASLDAQQIWTLLERVRDWNTNARTATVAQRVLYCLLKSYPATTFVDMAKARRFGAGSQGLKDLLRALEVYTDRHFKRMEELIDESYLIEYTLREMDEIAGIQAGPVVNGH
jgi:U3 small nucleolar RNA-associated protein 13